ncbi:FAD-dependent oxidoreductase [Massilia solisilvae]|uniref:FAD-dependent oxidoreductase n=1 Tax=Massilia solisilvae TaxID=1811225 RepID=A0ABT2BHM4_9BURK|nr:FAD-dependent oxidoreductase [Massilia solisilvae]MCS0608016.1 FAD-dependent oxidoreductase [Massilia solisilvae]
MPTLIVFCHLRWDFVFQRPQHLMTRLAEHYQILFVEEPVYHEGQAHLKKTAVAPNMTVCQPHTAIHAPGFHDDQIPTLQNLLADLVPEGEQPVVWFYTPMALPLLQGLHPALVVYDCMDELAAFKNSPKQLLQRETALLNIADLVFTGGPSLYEAKKERHNNAHCFPSSVDAAHFRKALDRASSHPSQEPYAGPRLGFYGVIDERFDTELVKAMAEAHPEWNIVLVGPVVKIDPAALPRARNIHYLGQQDYKALPQFLAGWDVCLLPFALNESTKFISPTKVLEYMAAELPVVSTPITDVKVPYGDVVAVAETPEQFITACERALAASSEQKTAMARRMREIVARTSWDNTATNMHKLIQATAPGNKAHRLVAHGGDAGAQVNPLPVQAAQKSSYRNVIIGGGPTGLSAAYHLGADTVLLERNQTIGGWCRSIEDNGFTFDYAGHIMFSNDPYVLKMYEVLLGDNVHWQNREAWVYSKGVYTRYPFQGALYGLPPTVITECVMGAIEARYGVDEAAEALDATQIEDCCADGTTDVCNTDKSVKGQVRNFEQFIYKVWGKGIAKHFAIPYNRKIWTVPLTEMETSWLGGRVPLPNLEEIISGALEPVAKPMGPNARFGYPKKGGFQALMDGFKPHIKGKVETNADVVQVLPREHVVALADGRRFRYDNLVSTMPLPELVKLIGDEAPEEVRAAAKGLRHVSIRCVNIGIDRVATDKHWIYYPEDTIFHRIFVQGNASPQCNPPGGFGFTCEISYSPYKPLPVDGDELIARAIEDCRKVGMIQPGDKILAANQVDMPIAYVLYDHNRATNVETCKAWLKQFDITLAGRYSEWEYYNSDHALLAGKKAADTVLALQAAADAAQASVAPQQGQQAQAE